MGGRGYHNDVKGYLNSNKRTVEYAKIDSISDARIDFITDVTTPKTPVTPEFSNSPNKIYALINKRGDGIKSITVYNKNHMQKYSIHLDHDHNKTGQSHVHGGISKGRKDLPLTAKHQRIIDEVQKRFINWRNK